MIETLQAATPEILLILLASAMYLSGTFATAPCRCWLWGAVGSLVLAAVATAVCAGQASPAETAVVTVDHVAMFAKWLILITGIALVLMSDSMSLHELAPEYFASLLLAVAGSMLVAGANELIILFLGLELLSVSTYVLLYVPRRDAASQESTAKYFLLNVFSSALFLYGLSFVYGAVGSTNLSVIASLSISDPGPALAVAGALIVAGLGFKVAAVPFHFYAPDVYEGTTNTLAALLAWLPKVAGFIALLRLLAFSMPYLSDELAWLAWVLATVTMTTGNLLGLLQTNLRRLFAYSSIAHAGYMLVGVGVGAAGGTRYLTMTGHDAVLFYLFAYAFMTIGVFAAIVHVSSASRRVETIDDLAGLARTHPGVALALAIFLFSLTGIPITAGFWGKLAIFSSALASHDGRFLVLAVIGVVNAAISSYYYLRIIGVMYMHEPYAGSAPRGDRASLTVVAVCAVVTLFVGFVPSPFLRWSARHAGAVAPARAEVGIEYPTKWTASSSERVRVN